MNTVAIVQARMGSTRLPGKVLRVLNGRTVLGHVIHRVRACPRVDEVVVAIPEGTRDDVLADEARLHGASVSRGSEEDVLARYYHAARSARADWVVRVTSDCPLFDPRVLGEMLEHFGAARQGAAPVDYLSNTLERTYPRGLDAEVFTREALARAHDEAADPAEREHVTPYLYRNPQQFVLRAHRAPVDLSIFRWTLDTDEDWRLIQAVYEELDNGEGLFSTADVLELMDRRPELKEFNRHVQQKAVGR